MVAEPLPHLRGFPSRRSRLSGVLLGQIVGSTGRASFSRWRASMARAAASILSAWRWKSARVPLRLLLALEGSLTPSMANISRPMSPMRSQMSRISLNSGPISPSRVLTKAAKVVKCGALSPD
jgi:hypothetical protein